MNSKIPWKYGLAYTFRALQALFALSTLMLILAMNSTTLITCLGIMGLRTDVADIIAIADDCGITSTTLEKGKVTYFNRMVSIPRCNDDPTNYFTVSVTVPAGREVELFVNGERAGIASSKTGVAQFTAVVLRPGHNELSATVIGSGRSDADAETMTNVVIGPFYAYHPPYQRRVAAAVDGDTLPAAVRLGYMNNGADRIELFSGQPDTLNATNDPLEQVWTGPDGLGTITHSANDDLPKNTGPTLSPPLFRSEEFGRVVDIAEQDSAIWRITVSACVPASGEIWRRRQQGRLSSAEFARRIAGFGPPPDVGDLPLSQPQTSPWWDGVCHPLSTDWTMPASKFQRVSNFYLLSLPGDKIVFHRRDNATLEWTGDSEGEANDALRRLSRQTTWSATQSQANNPHPSAFPTVAAAWSKTEQTLPSALRVLMGGIALMIPPLALLYGLKIGKPAATRHPALGSRRQGLFALMLVGASVYVVRLSSVLYLPGVSAFSLWNAISTPSGNNSLTLADPMLPLAIISSVIGIVILYQSRNARRRLYATTSALSTPLTALAAIAAFVLSLLPLAILGPLTVRYEVAKLIPLSWFETIKDILPQTAITHYRDQHVVELRFWVDKTEYLLPLFWVTLLVAPILAAIAIYCTMKSVVPGRPAVRASVIAGVAATILPLIVYFTEAGRIMATQHFSAGGLALDLKFLSYGAAFLVRFLTVFLMLWALREAFRSVAPNLKGPICQRVWAPLTLLTIAAAAALTGINAGNIAPAISTEEARQLAEIFSSLIAVVAAFAAISTLTTRDRAPGEGNGRKRRRDMAIVVAALAGYLARWTVEPMAALVAIAAAAFLFGKLILRPWNENTAAGMSPSLAAMITYRRDQMLSAQRLDKAERDFAAGTLDYAGLVQARRSMERIRCQNEKEVGGNFKAAKRALLNFGPENRPVLNGIRGALAGLVFATILQIAAAVFGQPVGGPARDWTMALADTEYHIAQDRVPGNTAQADVARDGAPGSTSQTVTDQQVAVFNQQVTSPGGYAVLNFIGTLLNAYFLWAILGFLFGYSFDRIRGTDGFVKGCVFACGVSGVFLIEQLLSTSTSAIDMLRLAPVFVFFIITGLMVFDAANVSRRGMDVGRLADIYGIRTTVGYVSFAGFLASLAPLAGILKSLLDKK